MNNTKTYRQAYITSTVTFSITLAVIVASLFYIIVGAKYLTVKRTFIQPKFVIILTTLLLVAVGAIVWNDYLDKVYYNYYTSGIEVISK
jgi:glucan phosphoethanolaminetransferase (alkaline phosphatase superfamily)